jgi:hypothetical protein
MKNEKALKAALAKRKPVVVYSDKRYTISTIPLNYRIWIKKPAKKGVSVDHDLYTDLDLGLENAKRVADLTLAEYFQT